jgi:hypothetical protein
MIARCPKLERGVRLPTQRLLEVLRRASDAFFQMRSVSGTAG